MSAIKVATREMKYLCTWVALAYRDSVVDLDCIVPYICIQIDVKAGQANDVHVTNNIPTFGRCRLTRCVCIIIVNGSDFFSLSHISVNKRYRCKCWRKVYYSISVFYLVQIKYFIMC